MAAKYGLAATTSSTIKGNNPSLGLTCSPGLVWSFHPQLGRLVLLTAVALAGCLQPAPLLATSAITYMQGNYSTPQTAQTTVKVTFTAAQAAGHLNVVVVGWNDSTAAVSTVTDKSGNSYTRAVGPTVLSGFLSQSIYYAKNIASAAAGANVVTVTFSTAAVYPDIRILEYSGADPSNPVDVTAASSGSSTTSSSGAATTTNATDLIFGANTVRTTTSGPSSGFTKRLLTPQDGDIAEDKMTTATGSYSATAPISPSGQWVMQMVAFRTPAVAAGSFTLSASPATTSFGNVVLGNSSTLPVILTNTGTGSVTISQDSVTGSGFSISGPALPFTLAAGKNVDFSLTFAPTATGSVTGNASVRSNATNSPSNEPLSGTGIHAVSLSWTASTSKVAGYNVYRGGQSGGPYTMLNSALLHGTTYVDSTVRAGQTYYYVTTAVNSADVESQYSNPVKTVVPSP
jgi:Abnormal spindle-like microcephaly-assoc'd, ASPM-SPD-2-Hydin